MAKERCSMAYWHTVRFRELQAGIVHRLDKDTSGLLVVACSSLAYKNLTKMIAIKLYNEGITSLRGKLVVASMLMAYGRDPKNRTKQVFPNLASKHFQDQVIQNTVRIAWSSRLKTDAPDQGSFK